MFLTRWRILASLGLAAFFVAAVALVVLDLRHRSRVRELTELADAAEADALRQRGIADSLRAVRVVEVDTFVVRRTRWDTLKTSDTVTVETLVQVADSTIASCDRALNACVAEVGVLNVALDSALSAAKLRKDALKPRRLFGLIPLPEVKPCANASAFYALDDQQLHAGVGGGLCLTF